MVGFVGVMVISGDLRGTVVDGSVVSSSSFEAELASLAGCFGSVAWPFAVIPVVSLVFTGSSVHELQPWDYQLIDRSIIIIIIIVAIIASSLFSIDASSS